LTQGKDDIVTSTDRTRLAVHRSGDPDRPTVVAVHGYPDNHAVWDGVVALLADRYQVVSYDVRGAGDSDKPQGTSSYRMPRLVDDLFTVLTAVSPERPVHLLAHDWGSIQSWPALTDPRATGRISSFTSVSGPSLEHVAAWLRAAHRHPFAALRQLRHSYYVGLFQLPALPEIAIRRGAVDRGVARARAVDEAAAAADVPRTDADKINGLQLYRANMLRHLGRGRPATVEVPVQVLAPRSDAFVTVELQTQAPRPYVRSLHSEVIDGGHWVVSDRPEVVARRLADFAERCAQT
jgi:pimeloyl-ACP methyl ester carboxylesterase